MIKGYKDSDYLELLAHWFDQMDKRRVFSDEGPPGREVQETLLRIAAKLRLLEAHEYMIMARKDEDSSA